MMDYARRAKGLRDADREIMSQLATSIWAGKMSHHSGHIDTEPPWTTVIKDAINKTS